MDDIYKYIKECNPNKKRKILIMFDDIIAHMLNNKKRNLTVTELFITSRNLNISLVFITQSYFFVPKKRLNSTHYVIMKISNKGELQQIASIHSSNNDFKDFMNFCKKCTGKSCSFLVVDVTLCLASDNLLRFRKNLSE